MTNDALDKLTPWLDTPLAEALLAQEQRLLRDALDGIFGEYLLQIGQWGPPGEMLQLARTQYTACIASHGPSDAVGQSYRLPVATESVDAVLLPHTLDFSSRPHAVLREVHRVLRSDGRLVLLGFKPGGLWGLRRQLPGAGFPPGVDRLISDRRIRDWLRLLDLRLQGHTRYFFRWPVPGNRRLTQSNWESRGRRWWPELAACYMLIAQKRIYTMTPVRPRWRRQPKVVGGLVNKPTTRHPH